MKHLGHAAATGSRSPGRGSCPPAAGRSTRRASTSTSASSTACTNAASRRWQRCSTGTCRKRCRTRGGWENRDCAHWFADYADDGVRGLGAAVPTWLTINEPKTIVQVGYTYGTMAPGKQDPVAAAVAMHHLALAHGLAVQAFRHSGQAGRIGPALNLAPAYPADAASDASPRAAVVADGIENRLYLDPIFKGTYPADAVAALTCRCPGRAATWRSAPVTSRRSARRSTCSASTTTTPSSSTRPAAT